MNESLKSSYFPVVEIAVLSIIRLTLLALLACVPLLAQAAPYQLTTAWPVNVGPLNPHLYTPNQMFAQSMVYEPLVKYQADGSVQPWLATRWRHSADGKTWWFTLRDDVAFSNGEPFNAQAAAPIFRRCWPTANATLGLSSPTK